MKAFLLAAIAIVVIAYGSYLRARTTSSRQTAPPPSRPKARACRTGEADLRRIDRRQRETICMIWLVAFVLALWAAPVLAQDLRGHGGPVRALGRQPRRARVFRLFRHPRDCVGRRRSPPRSPATTRARSPQCCRLPEGGFASGGQDGRVVIWGAGPEPLRSETGHAMPVAAPAPAGLKAWPRPDGTGGSCSGLGRRAPSRLPPMTGRSPASWPIATGWPAPARICACASGMRQANRLDNSTCRHRPRRWRRMGRRSFWPLRTVPYGGSEPGDDMLQVSPSTRPLLSVVASGGIVAAGGTTGEVWMLDPATLATRA